MNKFLRLSVFSILLLLPVGSQNVLAVGGPICVTPPSGMISWWPGDNNANDIQDGNHGTLQNGATFAAGKVGNGFSFDGSNDYVDVGDVDLPSTFTIDAWINSNSLGTFQTILSKDDGISRSYYFQLEAAGTLVGSVRNSAGDFTQYRTSAAVVTSGSLHHVAMTYDGNAGAGQKMKFYVDGVNYPTNVLVPIVGPPYDNGGTPENNALSLKLGIFGDAVGSPFNGVVDEVELFNQVLSQSEIQAIFNADFAGKCKPQIIGGEIIPIESTSLLLAGIQTTAIWMLPSIAGITAGAYFVRTRMNKDN